MYTIIISIICSIVASVIYGILIRKNEDRPITWIASLRHGWIRRRFVRAHIGAIRGRSRSSDTEKVHYVELLVPLLIIFFATWEAAEMKTDLDRVLEPKSEISTVEGLDSMIEEVTKDGERTIVILLSISGVAFLWYLAMSTIIIPFRALRSRISFELDRFTDYIIRLSSEEELKEIMIAEQKVTTEETLKSYFRLLIKCAERNGVEEYAKPLWIWDSEK